MEIALASRVEKSGELVDAGIAVHVEGLGKRYTLGARQAEKYTSLRDVIARGAKNLFRRNANSAAAATEPEPFWALKDISFQINSGEVVGIIGRNGAGKSTLLKLLSRITEPTEGRITINGRVASLLEVGTGFHPELTGRENIYLNGAILGMSRVEIKAKFDEIVSFSGVEKFLDTPVKRYSSGMYVRLAFAVAAHLEPEILVVDEVLAVGDAEFQKKCLGKMHDVATQGRTVLFVSHNIEAIDSLTTRSLLLDSGRLLMIGPTKDVVTAYLGHAKPAVLDLARYRYTSLPHEAAFESIWTESLSGERKASFRQGEPFRVCLRVNLPKRSMCDLAVVIENAREQALYTTHLADLAQPIADCGSYSFAVEMTNPLLRKGSYGVSVAAFSPDKAQFFDVLRHLPLFEIAGTLDMSFPNDIRFGDLYLPISWIILDKS